MEEPQADSGYEIAGEIESLRAELDRTKAELSGECKIKVGIVENVWNCKQDCDW